MSNLKHSPECVQFIYRAIELAHRDVRLSPSGIANADGVCRAALEVAVDYFGERGKDKLIDWGIQKSEDVGLIVYRLIDAQCVVKSETDSLDDFSGLFDLEQPPSTWKLQW